MSRHPGFIRCLATLWLLGSTAAVAADPRPLTVPEIGEDDLRVSFSGTDGDSRTFAIEPRLAFNATRNEYLAVWQAVTTIGGRIQVWAQRLSAIGQRLGPAVRMSSSTEDVSGADVSWSSVHDQYLVVWVQTAAGGANPEVVGRRMLGGGGALGYPFAISAANLHGDDVGGVRQPAVAYSSTLDEYVVVWSAAWDIAVEHQVWGRRLSGLAAPIGQPRMLSFLISPPSSSGGGDRPALTEAGDVFVVAFEGRGTSEGLALGETEIFVQRLTPVTSQGGSPDLLPGPVLRVSDVGGIGNAQYAPHQVSIARAANGQYLVAWDANEDVPGLLLWKREIWGQRLSADLVEIGPNDFRISRTGADSDGNMRGERPALAFHAGANRFLVAWTGWQGLTSEVRGQYLDAATGAALEPAGFPVSDEWPAGVGHQAGRSDAACATTCLALWDMQEPGNSPQQEFEIWGQGLCAYAAGDARYCHDCGPCQPGQGDCDSTAECRSGLTCTANVGANYGFPASVDVCEDHCPVPLGDASRCAQCGPCRWGEGDCDSDAECQSGLHCRHNVGGDFGWPAGIDVCLFPEV